MTAKERDMYVGGGGEIHALCDESGEFGNAV